MVMAITSTGGLAVELVGNVWRITGSVDDFLANGRNLRASNGFNRGRARDAMARLEARPDWFGMEAERVLSMRDWPDGRDLVDRFRQSMPEMPPLKSIRRMPAWAEDGDEFDRDRFDAGREDIWRTRRRQAAVGKPILKFTSEIGGHNKLDAWQLAWAGAVATAVCDAAEAAGYRVEIEALHASRDSYTDGRGVQHVIRVKAADEPLNIDRVALALACPAFFRWHVMRSNLIASSNGKKHYGYTIDSPPELRGDLHVGHAYNQAQASWQAGYLIRQIRRMAGEEEPEPAWRPPPTPYVPPATPSAVYEVTPARPAKAQRPAPAPKPVGNMID